MDAEKPPFSPQPKGPPDPDDQAAAAGNFGKINPELRIDNRTGRVRESFLSSNAKIILILIAVGAALFLTISFSRESLQSFPPLAAGSYLGLLRGVIGGNEQEPTRFYVEKSVDSDELFIAVLRPGWAPQVLSPVLVTANESTGEVRRLLPLTISSREARLRLLGEMLAGGKYKGIATNLSTRTDGAWELYPIPQPTPQGEDVASDVRLWLMLRDEVESINTKISEAESTVPLQKAEIERLLALLTEGETLRSKANEKFVSVRDELKLLQDQLKQKKQETLRLEEAFEVSQKVTPMGKLVSLSRESMEREWRRIDSLFRANVGEDSGELQALYQQAERIDMLKREIEKENQLIESHRMLAPDVRGSYRGPVGKKKIGAAKLKPPAKAPSLSSKAVKKIEVKKPQKGAV